MQHNMIVDPELLIDLSKEIASGSIDLSEIIELAIFRHHRVFIHENYKGSNKYLTNSWIRMRIRELFLNLVEMIQPKYEMLDSYFQLDIRKREITDTILIQKCVLDKESQIELVEQYLNLKYLSTTEKIIKMMYNHQQIYPEVEEMIKERFPDENLEMKARIEALFKKHMENPPDMSKIEYSFDTSTQND